MQRHAYLIPRSREHHRSLRLARDLQRADLDMADGQRRVQAEAPDLLRHFTDEENAFAELTATLSEAHPVLGLLDRMHREHRSLSALIELLCLVSPEVVQSFGMTALTTTYHTLGQLLAEHIAFEERSLFPALQACCLTPGPALTSGVYIS